MSTLITFFVAGDESVAEAAVDGGPGDDLLTAEFGNFDVWNSIEEWETLLLGTGEGPGVLGEGPLVLAFPAALTAALAAADVGDLSGRWAIEETANGQELEPEIAREIVGEVARLAGSAQRTGAGLYCWWC